MKSILFAVAAFCFYGTISAYNVNITINQYGRCNKEVLSHNVGEPNEFIPPHTFLYIPSLKNNAAKSNEIVRTKFYFRGKSDFSVAASQYQNSINVPFFQTIIAYYTTNSAIFFERVISTGSTQYCDKITNIPNMFSTIYYEELWLIITKDGVMSWYIPNQSYPFLKCYNPALKNIKYISFSGYSSRATDVYYADCPF